VCVGVVNAEAVFQLPWAESATHDLQLPLVQLIPLTPALQVPVLFFLPDAPPPPTPAHAEVFELFDQLALLARGKMVYFYSSCLTPPHPTPAHAEVFELFDQLALLARGKMVYFGPAQEADRMFADAGLPCPATRAPTDHMLHCVNEDFVVRRWPLGFGLKCNGAG